MIDGNASDFVDKITFQEEAVIYKSKKYFFHGLIYDPESKNYSFETHLWDSNNNYVDTVYKCVAETQDDCMEKVLNEPIIEGKCFWDIEQEMTWIEW